ncbi:TPA: peptidoglycan bridge formation glycyltransferase FemA/FemB family protein, partial [Staphylococcus aureus]|nr:peptidoglycan bridge formation glycyltransferase FemA/FemB family protein [Staphylococcus aureus]
NSEDYGVYRFKRGFNVQIEELIGDFYKPIHKVKYWLFTTLDKLRKKLKK